MTVSPADRLFGHVASITGLMSSSQVDACFNAVEMGEARDMATAASRKDFLAGDVAASVAIIAGELATRRIAEELDRHDVIASGKSRDAEGNTNIYPKSLGRYRDLKQVARGAMGIIFRATGDDGQEVALKVLPAHMVREGDEIQRFQREIETITRLVHPNIVRVFDFGQQDDYYYYAMEFLDGRSLRELIHDRGHLSAYHATEIVLEAARGLAHAHHHDVIHRDVKPSNIMIGSEGEVKLVDFGLALHKTSEILTATSISLGTPAYMSPEQIEGGREDLSPKSDIYSLGVTLYEALAGRRPFEGDNHYDVMKHVLFDQPVPIRQVRKSTPETLARIVSRCMARNPMDRYATMDEVVGVLEAFLEERDKATG